MKRRTFLAGAVASAVTLGGKGTRARAMAPASTSSARPKPASTSQSDIQWRDATELSVEGKGWTDTASFFDRLPARAKGLVRDPVWSLGRNSAGIAVRFQSDAPSIHVKYTLISEKLDMPHMPATGVSGVDLYACDDAGTWRWVGVVKPAAQHIEHAVVEGLRHEPGKPRPFMMYLPLYNGVKELAVGVPRGASLETLPPRKEKPIVYYGTSIAQGACASRPGMAYLAILGRRVDRPTINLGFSGNGRMDPEVGDLLAELDASVFVIDCLPNMTPEQVAERAEAFVGKLRAARPQTPIVLVEDRTTAGASLKPEIQRLHALRRKNLRSAYEHLVAGGAGGLSYVPGDLLLGDDDEATTDGSHPNDLGMVRYADALEAPIRQALGG